ncbi:hypothetical protein MHTCC0001_12810 [Flavobacteriaceae bacterium MHTCC 0001]
MVLTTTNTIDGYKIQDYLTIVSGIVVSKKTVTMGFSISKYYKAVEDSVHNTKEEAFQKLIENAKKSRRQCCGRHKGGYRIEHKQLHYGIYYRNGSESARLTEF